MTNPLLTEFTLPPFSLIKPKHILPAITKILNDCYITVEKSLTQDAPYTWDNLVQPIIESNDRYFRIFSIINHLNAVNTNTELREVYTDALLLTSKYNTWIGQNDDLYNAYCDLKSGENFSILNSSQKKVIDNILRDFKLSGVHLTKNKKKRYEKITSRLSELETLYSNNVLDATTAWSKLITNKKELIGIPENILESAKEYAKSKKQKGWLITLDTPCYLSVMTYCDNQELRKEIYYAYSTRASDQGPNSGKWNNGPIIVEQIALRHELANILGFDSYAHQSIETKMVKNITEVTDFLYDLLKLVQPQAKKELEQLSTFAYENYEIKNINVWDIYYYSEKQKKYIYNVNNEELRVYFPESRVLYAMFEIIKRIYGISIKERNNVDIYYPNVRFFDLFNEKNELQGSFYLDMYIRKNKRNGAWMDDCTNKMRRANGTLQKPIAYINCNFSYPLNDQTSILTHDEVIILFHEFGHALHHLLTNIDIPNISGINGVPWDAIEMPSQFMENWCWESDVLKLIGQHYKTGKQLPNEIINKILDTKNYQRGLFILRHLEFGLFDFFLHSKSNDVKNIDFLEVLREVRNLVSIIPIPEWERFPNAFLHIFSGNYAAGYYSYLWADVLASDAYSRFKEEGIFNRYTGQSFLENILMLGGLEDPIESFKRFRGRKPQLDAMLDNYGFYR